MLEAGSPCTNKSRTEDNLSLAVVDFESGGRSSVRFDWQISRQSVHFPQCCMSRLSLKRRTFSPDTGAVIREKKLRESPRNSPFKDDGFL